MLNRAEVKDRRREIRDERRVSLQSELEQSADQVIKRRERLHQLAERWQDFDQASERLRSWYDEKKRCLAADHMVPLKITDIERTQKKYQVSPALYPPVGEHEDDRTIFDFRMHWMNWNSNNRSPWTMSPSWVKKWHRAIFEKDRAMWFFISMVRQLLQPSSPSLFNRFSLYLELHRRLNELEERIDDRYRLLNGPNDQRRDFDQMMSKLQDWIKSSKQQIKDPLTNDLQQSGSGLKASYTIMFNRYWNQHTIGWTTAMIWCACTMSSPHISMKPIGTRATRNSLCWKIDTIVCCTTFVHVSRCSMKRRTIAIFLFGWNSRLPEEREFRYRKSQIFPISAHILKGGVAEGEDEGVGSFILPWSPTT